MSKFFKEVFAGLTLDGQLSDLLDTAEVTRVCTNRAHTHLRIYLRGHRLIFKKNIWKLEREIKNQLFAGQDVDVTVIESFELSAQYNVKNYYEEYKSSIQDELSAYSSLEYNLLRMADVDFEEDHRLVLTLEDTPIAHTKSDDLVEYLEKVFCERGGMDMIVKVAYKEHKESKFRHNSELQMQREVENILARTKLGEQQREEARQAEKESFLGEGGVDLAGEAGHAGGVDSSGVDGRSVPGAGSGSLAGTVAAGSTSGKGAQAGSSSRVEAAAAGSTRGKGAEVAGSSKGGKTGAGYGSSANGSGKGGTGSRGYGNGSGYAKKGEFRRRFDRDSTPKSQNPDVIYGRDFDDNAMNMDRIDGPIGEITVRGQIMSMDTREIRNERTIVMGAVTDFTDSIGFKIFAKTEDVPDMQKELKKGAFVKIKGSVMVDRYDNDLSIGSVYGIKKCPDFRVPRMDTAPEKRVELHCHTKMSDMDAVSDVSDIIACAKSWGMRALAVTDHGNVQAFPDAAKAAGKDLKVI